MCSVSSLYDKVCGSHSLALFLWDLFDPCVQPCARCRHRRFSVRTHSELPLRAQCLSSLASRLLLAGGLHSEARRALRPLCLPLPSSCGGTLLWRALRYRCSTLTPYLRHFRRLAPADGLVLDFASPRPMNADPLAASRATSTYLPWPTAQPPFSLFDFCLISASRE